MLHSVLVQTSHELAASVRQSKMSSRRRLAAIEVLLSCFLCLCATTVEATAQNVCNKTVGHSCRNRQGGWLCCGAFVSGVECMEEFRLVLCSVSLTSRGLTCPQSGIFLCFWVFFLYCCFIARHLKSSCLLLTALDQLFGRCSWLRYKISILL